MKERKNITKEIYKIIKKQIEKSNEELGVDFNVDDIIIYGSTLTNKDNPSDIDIFIKISNIDSEFTHDFQCETTDDKSEEDQFQIHLSETLHDFFHGEFSSINMQPKFNGKKVDINVSLVDFEECGYFGESMKLDDFFKKQELIYGKNDYSRKKIILFHGTSNHFQEFNELSIGNGEDPNSSLGIHTTTSPFYAAEYADLKQTIQKKEGFVYALEVEYCDYDHIESNDEFYGTEIDETNTHEYFKELRNDYLEENIDLIFFENKDNITTILNPNNIKIISKISIKDSKKLDIKLEKLNIDPLKDFKIILNEINNPLLKNNLKLKF
jgi:predicted nucleotidyltransferase